MTTPDAPEDAVVAEIIDDDGFHGELEPEPLTPADLGLELPEDRAEAEALLLRAAATARADADEYLENLQRVAADFENYRKRTLRDQKDLVEHATQRLLEKLLPALDSFDAALAYEPQTPTEEKILEGMAGTRYQLLEILGTERFSVIPASPGEPFDPAVHEAVSGPTGGGEGALVIGQELRRGYRLGDRVVRASLVTVEHG